VPSLVLGLETRCYVLGLEFESFNKVLSNKTGYKVGSKLYACHDMLCPSLPQYSVVNMKCYLQITLSPLANCNSQLIN